MTASAVIQNPKTRPLPRAERDAQILKLRALGQPILSIADRLGCGEKTVRRVVGRRLEQLNREIRLDSGQLVAQHLLELEQLRARLAPALAAPEPGQRLGAVRTWLQLLEREARLLGIDAPARIEMAAQAQASEALLQHLADRLPAAVMDEVINAITTP